MQLIRYESVELTEQLMRERQSRQTDEDRDQDQDQEMEGESGGPAPTQLQHELRGVLLEEQRVQASANKEGGGQEGAPTYTFT